MIDFILSYDIPIKENKMVNGIFGIFFHFFGFSFSEYNDKKKKEEEKCRKSTF